MRKIAIVGASVALMLAVTVPAFASTNNRGDKGKDKSSVKVTNSSNVSVTNNGGASNGVLTVANTGLNVVVSSDPKSGDNNGRGKKEKDSTTGGTIGTGAATANSVAGNVVGTTYVGSTCNTCGTQPTVTNGSVTNESNVNVTNYGSAHNGVATVANSGANFVSGNGGTIGTGTAKAGSLVVNVVGTTIVK